MSKNDVVPAPGPLRRYAAEHGHDKFLAWIGRTPRHASNDARGAMLVTRSEDTHATPSQRLTPAGMGRRRRNRAARRLVRMVARLVADAVREEVARDTVVIAARIVAAALAGKATR